MPVPRTSMASQLEATSAILGEYMLKGWTLTDLHCDTCHVTPLMREPAAQASAANRPRIQFCAQCDGSPEGRTAVSSHSVQSPSTNSYPPEQYQTPDIPSGYQFASPLDPDPPIASGSSRPTSAVGGQLTTSISAAGSVRARAPAPPPTRQIPITPHSTDNLRDFPAPPSHMPPPSNSSRRSSTNAAEADGPHSQSIVALANSSSSEASASKSSEEVPQLISQRLLQGYSLLQLNCPNCRGVPLIGFPRRPDGSKDPRRGCVSCGKGYVESRGVGGKGGLVEMPPAVSAGGEVTGASSVSATPAASSGLAAGGRGEEGSENRRAAVRGESPRSKARREMYETGETINIMKREAESREAAGRSSHGKDTTSPVDPEPEDGEFELDDRPRHLHVTPDGETSAIDKALSRTTDSLALTLDSLASSLEAQVKAAHSFVDIKLHTEAIRDVLDVLRRVKEIQ